MRINTYYIIRSTYSNTKLKPKIIKEVSERMGSLFWIDKVFLRTIIHKEHNKVKGTRET
jgi:hypothetical protein